jgi:uncharacterized SAM-binding protein YcdF (DUF218 family)
MMRAVFLWLSKVLDWFVSPLGWTFLLAGAGVYLRRRRAGTVCLALSAAVLAAFSSELVSDRLMAATERGARSTYRPDAVYDAVIVLSGFVDADASRATGEAELLDGAERLLRGFELYRAGRVRNVLLSGGLVFPRPGDVSEADRLAAKLAEWGIPSDRIAVERSRRPVASPPEISALRRFTASMSFTSRSAFAVAGGAAVVST